MMAWLAPGSVLTTAQTSSVVYEARSAKLVADGKTDDSTALESAIANAIAGNYGTIQLPCGQIMVTKAINLTNRSNLTLQGCGSNQDYGNGYPKTNTQILCNTGTVCLDTTGSSRITLKAISLRAANSYSSPSTVGILMGRDNSGGGGSKNAFCFAQWNTLDEVYVYMDSLPTASPRGRIGVYDIGAEHFTIRGGKYIADDAVFFGATNVLQIKSPYQTLATGCPASMAGIEINGIASFQSWTFFGLEFSDAQTITADRCHMIAGHPGLTAINFASGDQVGNIKLACQIEYYASVMNTNVNLDHLDTTGLTVVGPEKPLFGLNSSVTITSSKLGARQIHGQPQPLFNGGSNDLIRGSQIDLGTLAGINSPGIKIIGSIVMAPGHQDVEIKFAPGSQYLLLDDEGMSAVGGLRSH